MARGRYLVIGADGFLGAGLMKKLQSRGHKVTGTTRRAEATGGARIFLNLNEPVLDIPPDATHAFFVAADTSFIRCRDSQEAYNVNVIAIPALIENCLKKGIHTVFTSSNSVFGGTVSWPAEDAVPQPVMPYARHKALAERAIIRSAKSLGAENLFSIVRLTKVLNSHVPPLPQWLPDLSAGKPIRPFSDFIFAPVTLDFVTSALALIAEKNISGILHLSGAENISYLDFALLLAARMDASPHLIEPSSSTDAGITLHFKPKYSGLGMPQTQKKTRLAPQPLHEVIEAIVSDYKKENNNGCLSSQ